MVHKQLQATTSDQYARNAAILGAQYRKFFGASIAAVLLLQVTIVTDTILVGQLVGAVPMSGVRVASPIVNMLNVLAMLVGVGGATLISIAIGRRERDKANRAFTLTIVLSIAIGLAFALIIAPFADTIARLISSDDSTVGYTATFMRIVTAASPVYILASVMVLLLRADSCIKLSSVVLSVGGVANVAFDLLFMGVFGMGVAGAALATDAGMLSAVLLSLLFFRWPKRTLRLVNVFGSVRPDLVGGVFKNGAPGALRMLFACISLLFLNYVVGNVVGVMGIAFMTVCGNIQLLAMAFFSAGGQAAMPMEGVLYGEHDYHGLLLLVRYVFRVVVGCVVAIIVLICAFPSQIVGLFVPGGIDGSAGLLRLYSLGFLPVAVNYVLTYHYNTIQQRKVAMSLTLCENLVLYLPLIWVLTKVMGLIGTVLAFLLAEVLALCVALILAIIARRKQGLDNILLLPSVPSEHVFEATVPVSNADAAGIAHSVKAALDACGVDSTVSLRTAIGAEEVVANAAANDQNLARGTLCDVLVANFPEYVQVSLRDNGVPFDPRHCGSEDDAIAVMCAVASSVDYQSSLGMNRTVIKVEKEAAAQSERMGS